MKNKIQYFLTFRLLEFGKNSFSIRILSANKLREAIHRLYDSHTLRAKLHLSSFLKRFFKILDFNRKDGIGRSDRAINPPFHQVHACFDFFRLQSSRNRRCCTKSPRDTGYPRYSSHPIAAVGSHCWARRVSYC